MCEYCKNSAFTTMIESSYTEYANNIFGNIYVHDEPFENDNSVVFEIRCGAGYIRLGDRGDMNCIDTERKFKVNFCPMCGRKL